MDVPGPIFLDRDGFQDSEEGLLPFPELVLEVDVLVESPGDILEDRNNVLFVSILIHQKLEVLELIMLYLLLTLGKCGPSVPPH